MPVTDSPLQDEKGGEECLFLEQPDLDIWQ